MSRSGVRVDDTNSYHKPAVFPEYAKRLQRFCKFEIIEVPEGNARERSVNIREETASIVEKLKGHVILCDVGGKIVSSEEISALIGKISENASTITFVIGGSDGVGENLDTAVHEKISFGRATFPHQLFRVMLSEQIYRAMTILHNRNYHK